MTFLLIILCGWLASIPAGAVVLVVCGGWLIGLLFSIEVPAAPVSKATNALAPPAAGPQAPATPAPRFGATTSRRAA